jgi:multiple sugar transport system ATP-binding protein
MDEPLSNLDAKQRVTMRAEIIDIHRKTGATTVYVTHDQVEAMTMADRIVVMRDGVVRQVGTPRELYFDPDNQFVAGFIGDPPMNFIPCLVSGGKAILQNTDIALRLPKRFAAALKEREGRGLTLGFRPEAAVLTRGENETAGAGIGLTAQTQTLELFGDSVSVFADIGAHSVILRTAPDRMPDENAEVRFIVPADDIYLFDPDQNGATVKTEK